MHVLTRSGRGRRPQAAAEPHRRSVRPRRRPPAGHGSHEAPDRVRWHIDAPRRRGPARTARPRAVERSRRESGSAPGASGRLRRAPAAGARPSRPPGGERGGGLLPGLDGCRAQEERRGDRSTREDRGLAGSRRRRPPDQLLFTPPPEDQDALARSRRRPTSSRRCWTERAHPPLRDEAVTRRRGGPSARSGRAALARAQGCSPQTWRTGRGPRSMS